MRQTRRAKVMLLVLVLAIFEIPALLANSWSVERSKKRIVARPDAIWQAGDAGLIVSCVGGNPQFAVLVRDPIPRRPKVRLQFGGHRGRKIHFLGEDGIVREFSGFLRGTNSRLAIASTSESREIVMNLLPNASRVAWFVDMDDGFDSLEVSTTGFNTAWQQLGCAATQR